MKPKMTMPPAAMTRDEFIDSLWTDTRRADAYKLWDELIENVDWMDMVMIAREAQDLGNREPWEMLVRYFGQTLKFASDEDRWNGLVPMVVGGVMVTLGLPLHPVSS